MYEANWISLTEALSRLVGSSDRLKELARDLWTALSDGAVRAQGRTRKGDLTTSGPIDRYMFKASSDIDDILEQIRECVIIDWSHHGPVRWDVEVPWDAVTKVLRTKKVATSQPELDFNAPRLIVGIRARLDNKVLQLAPQSLDLLRELASAAAKSEAPVSKQFLENEYFHKRTDDKAVAHAISRLRNEITDSGFDRHIADDLIENVRSVGWRLNLPSSQVKLEV
jgi:hypothetical protein